MITHNHQHRHSILIQPLDAARFELARLQQWIDDNMEQTGTVKFLRAVMAHRVLFDLIARNGSNRGHAMHELTAIQAGELDHLRYQSIG